MPGASFSKPESLQRNMNLSETALCYAHEIQCFRALGFFIPRIYNLSSVRTMFGAFVSQHKLPVNDKGAFSPTHPSARLPSMSNKPSTSYASRGTPILAAPCGHTSVTPWSWHSNKASYAVVQEVPFSQKLEQASTC